MFLRGAAPGIGNGGTHTALSDDSTTHGLEISFAGQKKNLCASMSLPQPLRFIISAYPAKKMCQPYGCCVSVWVQNHI